MKKILMTLTLALGAVIAIPAAANAQSTTASTEKTAECCKDKKACAKEGEKACANAEGKACCKSDSVKKGMHKAQPGKKGKTGRNLEGARQHGKVRKGNLENPMMKGITLSEEQQQKVKALREKSMTSEKQAKADAKAKSRDEIQKLRAEFDKEMEKILDKDQLKQYQANKAEMEARRAAKATKETKRAADSSKAAKQSKVEKK